MKHVFETYFKGVTCYVAENTGENSLLNNGDFEDDGFWELGGGAGYTEEERLSGKRGLYFGGNGGETCIQRFERPVDAGNYAFHFFLKGKCGLVIQDGEGRYWNANDQAFNGGAVLEWADGETVNIFEKPDGWDNAYCFIKAPETVPGGVTFKFYGLEGETAFIDYARLYTKPPNSSYTLIFQYEGYAVTGRSLHLGENGEDPAQGADYENESYYDRAFIVGPTGVSQSQAFKSVLDLVRPKGIQAFVEFIEKNTAEGDM